ncbi:MAG: MATE family efflux transporter, partial [Epulopiscium sp. Nele67-Bin001]
MELDLTTGNILSKLIKLSLPIMGTAFIQTAYNMIDMMWIGRLGSDEVAAVGTASFFPWLAMAFVMISKIGAEIKVAQSMGEKDFDKVSKFVTAALQINVVLAIIYGLFVVMFNRPLIGFFNLGDENIINMAQTYLTIIGAGMLFIFITPVFTAIFNGLGDSKTPFAINTIGLVFNIVLDPILIFGWLGMPALGVVGAALATIFSQALVAICFVIIIIIRNKRNPEAAFFSLNILTKPPMEQMQIICQIGLPVALQSGLFTIFSMVLGRIIAAWGAVPIAVQKVGSQIEAVSWMSASGISTALGAFVGQNYGAGKLDRIEKGFKCSVLIAIVVGTFATILLVVFGSQVFSVFIQNEPETLLQGIDYLKIVGYSQI